MDTSNAIPFRNAKFNIQQFIDLMNISRTTLYQYEKQNIISSEKIRAGATTRRIYDWEDIKALSRHIKSKRPKLNDRRVKVFANLKGGVGKSSLSAQVAMRAAASGVKTLLIDLDPQAHATHIVGLDAHEAEWPTVMEAILNKKAHPLSKSIIELTPLLSIIPASLKMSRLDVHMQLQHTGLTRLKELIAPIKKEWELIIIDTNPSASLLNLNALYAADEICVVCATDFLSVAGLNQFFTLIHEIEDDEFDPKSRVKIIPNMYDMRETIAQQALGFLHQSYQSMLTTTIVRRNVDLKEAVKAQQAIWLHARRSPAAEDIISLTHELITGQPRKPLEDDNE